MFKKVLIGLGILAAGAGYLWATTTNMGLDLPVVGVTTGPDWATKINTAFGVIDVHDHTAGKGIQISNAGVSSAAAITRSKLATGGASYVIIDDTSGNLSSEQTLAVQRGGTNIGYYAIGDILYASSPTGLTRLPIGSANQLLKVASGLPSWATTSPTAAPTVQKFLSGSGTYTTPTFPTTIYIVIRLVGGGGGGAAQTTNAGSTGGNTTFSVLTGSGGVGGAVGSAGGAGGAAALGGATGYAIPGGGGGAGSNNSSLNFVAAGGAGGSSALGGGGTGGGNAAGPGAGAANSGGGGGGAQGAGSTNSGGGGGSGGFVEAIFSAPAASYLFAVGAAGAGGSAGGVGGGAGAAGQIVVFEYY